MTVNHIRNKLLRRICMFLVIPLELVIAVVVGASTSFMETWTEIRHTFKSVWNGEE
jgi:hypothetical protein